MGEPVRKRFEAPSLENIYFHAAASNIYAPKLHTSKTKVHAMLRFAPGSGAERFSTRTRKTFNISTEFYTEYSGFSTAFVESVSVFLSLKLVPSHLFPFNLYYFHDITDITF